MTKILPNKYPVLYILHGGGEDERGWANQGKADLILDNLIAQNKAMPMIIVMPDGNVESMGIFGEMTLKMFEAELKNCIIPFVEKITVQRRIPEAVHLPAYQWVVYRPFMLGLIIQICSRILGFSVVAGYNPCKRILQKLNIVSWRKMQICSTVI